MSANKHEDVKADRSNAGPKGCWQHLTHIVNAVSHACYHDGLVLNNGPRDWAFILLAFGLLFSFYGLTFWGLLKAVIEYRKSALWVFFIVYVMFVLFLVSGLTVSYVERIIERKPRSEEDEFISRHMSSRNLNRERAVDDDDEDDDTRQKKRRDEEIAEIELPAIHQNKPLSSVFQTMAEAEQLEAQEAARVKQVSFGGEAPPALPVSILKPSLSRVPSGALSINTHAISMAAANLAAADASYAASQQAPPPADGAASHALLVPGTSGTGVVGVPLHPLLQQPLSAPAVMEEPVQPPQPLDPTQESELRALMSMVPQRHDDPGESPMSPEPRSPLTFVVDAGHKTTAETLHSLRMPMPLTPIAEAHTPQSGSAASDTSSETGTAPVVPLLPPPPASPAHQPVTVVVAPVPPAPTPRGAAPPAAAVEPSPSSSPSTSPPAIAASPPLSPAPLAEVVVARSDNTNSNASAVVPPPAAAAPVEEGVNFHVDAPRARSGSSAGGDIEV